MGLPFFADHCVSNAIMQMLRDAGHDVLRLRDQLPIESPDPVVIAKAHQLDALLLSLNGDFADIVRYPPANYKGIIALQVRNHPEIIPELVARLRDYLSSHADREYYRGKLLVVEVHRIRARRCVPRPLSAGVRLLAADIVLLCVSCCETLKTRL